MKCLEPVLVGGYYYIGARPPQPVSRHPMFGEQCYAPPHAYIGDISVLLILLSLLIASCSLFSDHC